ncbi:MAG: hypothetical protein CMK09_15110 [Ponticaulis sp.]|nr:hypothetical protein [Ponticaulis sp.]
MIFPFSVFEPQTPLGRLAGCQLASMPTDIPSANAELMMSGKTHGQFYNAIHSDTADAGLTDGVEPIVRQFAMLRQSAA